jgi:DNA repair exonuclease SbcCD ATPase subunit
VAQALKDVFPYLLGAVTDDYVKKREELRRIKDKLRNCERRLAELAALRGNGVSKAATLLAQARDCGLTLETESNNWDAVVAALRKVASTPLAQAEERTPTTSEFTRLSEVRSALLDEQRRLRDQIAAARTFKTDEKSFSREATEQQARLKSIGIFEGAEPGEACPLCSHPLTDANDTPSVSQLKGELKTVSTRLDAVTRSEPQMEKAVAGLEEKSAGVQRQLIQNRAELEAIRSANEQIGRARDEAAKRAHVLGRISLYLESLPDLPDTTALQREATELCNQCAKLEEELSDETIRERLESIADAGHFASYCRCVKSVRQSNHKKKGENNRKCGNKYLAWAFVEAAHFACRHDERCRRFYDRKKQQANPVIATKSLACKLAKASWHVMKEDVPYDATRVFGPARKSDFGETGREPAKGSGHPSQQD